ncbi:MAG: carboxypeptidase-like regulatory domain-containing protein, partial [Bacteroidales bacterium]
MCLHQFKRIISFLIIMLTAVTAFSQGRNSISGKVIDAETGEHLTGAAIQVKNTSIGTVTGLDGHFELTNIVSDKVILLVSFISYELKTIELDLSGKSRLEVTIELIPVATQLQEVEVKSHAEGQIKAMLDQKVAVNIKNIVSSEQIEKFPDMNAAEVLQRIPGITLQRDQGEGRFVQLRGTPPELTNFNINGEQIPSPEGNVRYVGLDVIAADQIEFIEVSKVLTPDMDADGIGGTVNIITKTANSEIPEIRTSIAGGYNNLRKTGNYQLQFSYGQRYNKLGFNLNASQYVNNQGSDNIEFKYEKSTFYGNQDEGVNNYHVQYREIQLRHYNITRARTGLSATLDYEFNPNSFLYLRFMYNRFSDYEVRRRVVYDLDDAVTEQSYLYGGIDRDIKDREKIQTINTVNFGGEHLLGPVSIDYEMAYALAREEQPNRVEVLFDNPGQAIFMKFDLTDRDWPRLILPRAIDSTNAFNYPNYEFEELLLLNSHINDRNITAKINFKIPFSIGGNEGFFKFGGKTRLKEKVRNIDADVYSAYFTTSRTYPGEGPELFFTDVVDDFSENNLLNKGYVVDYIPSSTKMYDFFQYYKQFFILDRTDTKFRSYGEDYTANEDIYALYGMLRYDINNLLVLGGLRYEKTDIRYEGF